MNGTEVILPWAQRLGPSPVVLAESAEALAGRFGERPTVAVADRQGADPSVCVHVIPLGGEGDVAAVLSAAADRDVVVLLLRAAPTSIPLGALIADATRAGMRVLEAGGSREGLGRTTIVLSRDAALPRRPTALDAYLTTTPELDVRLGNEWLLERLVLTAALESAQARADALAAELDVARADVAAAKAATAKAHLAAEAHQAEGALTGLRRDAATVVGWVREDPVQGARRVAVAAARRLQGRRAP